LWQYPVSHVYYGSSLGEPTNPVRINGYGGTSIIDASTSTGYLDNSATMGVTLAAGATYVITIGSPYYSSLSYQAWIDFNADGTFQSSESVGGSNIATSTTVRTFNITLPAGSAACQPGTYRLRLETEMLYYRTYPSLLPCPAGTATSNYYGDVRDYKVTFYAPPVCTFTPASLSFTPVTPGSTATLATSVATSYLVPSNGNLTVTAPSGYYVYNGSSYVASYAIGYTGGTTSALINVQFAPSVTTTYSGNITITGGGLSSALLPVTGTGATTCTGTPTPGATSASPLYGNAATAFTVVCSGYTPAAGIALQWQSSPDSISWSNVSGATNSTYNFTGLASSKYFRCLVTCSSSGLSANSLAVWVQFLPNSGCRPTWFYATGSCASGRTVATPTNPFRITGDAGTSIIDSDNCNGSGYTDQTASRVVTLSAGGTYGISFGTRGYYEMTYQVWIDFNNDGTFQTTESVGGTGSRATLSVWSTTITIPGGGAVLRPGYYRMRVEGEYYNLHNYPYLDPCPDSSASFDYGEVRDYLVKLQVPPSLAVTPTAYSFPATAPGSSSAPQRNILNGSLLTPLVGNLSVTAPTGFQVYNGSSWASSYSISYTGGTVAFTTIQVRFSPSAASAYSGNVVVSGGGAASRNIAVAGTGATGCSATPSAGAAVSAPTSGSSATTFTLSLTGATVLSGMSYQWQSAPTSGGTWTNITGATNPTYIFSGLMATTYYRCQLTCTGFGTTATSSVATASLVLPTASCTPNTTTGPTSAIYSCTVGAITDYKTSSFVGTTGFVKLNGASGSINDVTACNNSGYMDRTALSVTLRKGSVYTMSLQYGGGMEATWNYNQWWIDFNSNGTFEVTESVGFDTVPHYATTIRITIPSSVPTGVFRMRGVCNRYTEYHSGPAMDPCMNSYRYGEGRDYTVIIVDGTPAITSTPSSVTFVPITPSTSSAPTGIGLTGIYLTPATGAVTVTAPSYYTVSNSASGTYTSSLAINYTGSTIPMTSVFVRFNAPATTGTYTGTMTISGGGASTLNVPLSANSSYPCTGTPAAGSVTATPASGNVGLTSTLSVTGASTGLGISYQWQSSSSGTSGSFTNISGATASTYIAAGLVSSTYFQCVVNCSYSGFSATTAPKLIAIYCIPVWRTGFCSGLPNSIGTPTYPIKLNGVSGAINDVNSCNSDDYIDETASTSVTLNAGSNYTITVGNANLTRSPLGYQVWIDFNNDGTFQTTESVGGLNANYYNTATFVLAIPSAAAGIVPGTYRMRVMGEYQNHYYPGLNPCAYGETGTGTDYEWGESRDYSVTINVPPTGIVTPASMGFAPTTVGTSTVHQSAAYNATYLSPASGNYTVAAPAGFQVFNPSSSSWVNSYTMAYTGSNIVAASLAVRFTPTATGVASGNVAITGGGVSGVNIAVTGAGAAACSGMPTAGSATSSTAGGNSTTAFTLACSGYSVSGGIQFQWQFSPDSTSWTNITAATNYNYNFTGITATTYYRCRVTCSVSSVSANTAAIKISWFPPSGCTPVYAEPSMACAGGIVCATTANHLKLNGESGTSINDGAGCTGTGYLDNSGTMGCTLKAGTTYTMTAGNSGGSNISYQVWVDFNNDGIFQTTESVGGNGISTSATPSFTITLPAGSLAIAPGVYRMRIAADANIVYPSLDPCSSGAFSGAFGETRDYKINFTVPPTGSLSVTRIPFPPTTVATSSSPVTTVFNGYYLSPNTGNVTVTAPVGFQVFNGSTYVSSYSISYTGGTVTANTISVRFSPVSVASYLDTVRVSGGGITVPAKLVVTGNGATVCSGTPTAGTASASIVSGNASTPVTLTVTGFSVAGGIQFQWQQSATGTSGWSNISGATVAVYNFTGITVNTYYRCRVTCAASGNTDSTIAIVVRYFPASGCTPAYFYASTSCYYGIACASPAYPLMLNGLSSTSINDATSCDNTGYIDQTASMGCTLSTGSTYTMTTGGGSSYRMTYQVFIDFNSDGMFQNSESVGGSPVPSISARSTSFTISIPSSGSVVTSGVFRMRVVADYYVHAYPSLNPCPDGSSTYYYGECRDYKITLRVPPTATASPTALAFPVTTVADSATLSTVINATYLSPFSGSLTITAPANYKVFNPAASRYVSSYTVTYNGATLGATTQSVRFYPPAASTYTGNITVTGGGISTLNIPVTGTGAARCTATPTAGTAVASPTTASSTSIINLSLSGTSGGGGITYQWEVSPNGTTWTTIAGATNPTYSTTGIVANTYYHCIIACPYGGSTVTSASAMVTWSLPATSCTPSPTSAYTACTYYSMSFGNVSLTGYSGAINDNLACDNTGYRNRTALSCTVFSGSSYPISITFGGGATAETNYSQWWIDFNNNGSFEATESVGYNTSDFTAGSVTISIPSTVAPGTYRMRGVTSPSRQPYAGPTMDPCMTGYNFGEGRDYTIIVQAPLPAASTSAGTLAFGTVLAGSSSAAMSVVLSASYLSPASGALTVSAPSNFEVSTTGTSGWTGSLSLSYSGGSLSTPLYFRFNPSAATFYYGSAQVTGGGLAAPAYVYLNGTGAVMCTGIPTPGTASIAPPTGGSGSSFTLGLTGTSTAAGLTYQWQSAVSPSGSWHNIAAGTTSTYTFNDLTDTTYYRCQVGCPSYGNANSNTVSANWILQAACTPSWYYPAVACSYQIAVSTWQLTGSIGSIYDGAACTGTGYQDRTALSTTLFSGNTYTASFNTLSGYLVNLQTWIDFNGDGTFQSTESVGGGNAYIGAGRTYNISIPASGLATGTYRMRVICEYGSHTYPTMNPCPDGSTAFQYGEVRDYKVTIIVPSSCIGTPVAGSVTASSVIGCSPVNSSLSLASAIGVSGLNIRWQSSATGAPGSYSDISGATGSTWASSSTAATTTTPTYYRAVVTCASSGLSDTSISQTVTAYAPPSGITGPGGVCFGSSVTLGNSLPGGSWASTSVSVATVNPSTGSVYGVSPGSCTISYTTPGCAPVSTAISVNSAPGAITGLTSMCIGGTATLSDASPGGTWSSSNTGIVSIDPASGVATALGVGTATISYSNGCGSPATTTWTTNASPAAFVGPASICTLSTGTFVDTATGGTWSVSPTTFGTINPTTGVFSSGTALGTAVVMYTIGYCSVTGGLTVGSGSPVAIAGSSSICAGASTSLTNATPGGSWTSSDPSIATVSPVGIVTGISSGTPTITYSTGCGTAATRSMTVNGAQVTITAAPVCSQSTLSLNATVGAGTYTFSWTGPNSFTSTMQNPAITNAPTKASGTYSVTASQGGCTGTSSYWIAVDSIPQANISSSPSTICSGGSTTLNCMVTSPSSSGYNLIAVPYAPVALTTVVAGPVGVSNSVVTLPFSFNYYGNSYSTVNISTQGYISFGASSSSTTPITLPSAVAPSGIVALFWHNLNASSGSIGYSTVGAAPNRKFVVRFNAVNDYTGAGVNSGQIVLYETSNVIDMYISKANTAGAYASVCGIQNTTGTSAVTVNGQNNANYTINTTSGNGWRFERPNYTYAWSPATSLSNTFTASPVSSGLSATQVFTVVAVDANSACTSGSTLNTTVTVNARPTSYALTPAAGCSTGTTISLTNSQTSVNYQLYRGDTAIGVPVSGTGSAISFPAVTNVGVYKVVGILASSGCTSNMIDSTIVYSLPATYTVTGGSGCSAAGVTVGLSGSDSSTVSYQLYNGSTAVGSSIAGTNSPITFGLQTVAGTYTVVATNSGGCQSAMADSSEVIAAPTAYSVTGGAACTSSGVTIGLSGSQIGVSYRLYRADTLADSLVGGTGAPIYFGFRDTAGTYKVIATGIAGCQMVQNDSVLINTSPTISLGSSPSLCQPATSATITYSGAGGSPVTYSIAWDTAAISAGFVPVAAAALDTTTITIAIPSTGIWGSYTGSVTVSNGTCASASYPITVTLYAAPSGTIASALAPCTGHSTNIVFNGTPGQTLSYMVDSGAVVDVSLDSGGTYTLPTGTLTSAHTYTLHNVHNPVCSLTIDSTIVVNPLTMQWVGGATGFATDWNTAANWTCGSVPVATDDVIIPSGSAYSPVINASASGITHNLMLQSGTQITIGAAAILHVKGLFSNNGVINGAGVITMDSSVAQLIQGHGSVAQFDVNNAGGVTIDSLSTLTVNGVLSITAGTFATNDSLILASDSALTARVAPLPATGSAITGNATVMQFIQGGRRAFRFWAHPFSNYISLSQLTNYVDITGTGGTANGFTATASNAPSAFRYDPNQSNSALGYDPGWKAFTSAFATVDSNRIHRYQGLRVYIRGGLGEGLGFASYTPSAVTIGQWGVLNQGDQTVALVKGAAPNQDYNMVGNPYAAPVDIGTVAYNAKVANQIVGAAFYVWNPYLGSVGQYQAIGIGTTAAVPYYLQANSCFQVRAAHNGDVLDFNENNKGTSPTAVLLKAGADAVALTVYDANYHPWDMLSLVFNEHASVNEDNNYDAIKPEGPEFNFYSISGDNKKLAIDGRPFKAEGTIPIGVRSNIEQDFIIKASSVTTPDNSKIYLHDKLLQQYTLLQVGTEYRFSVTADTITQGEGRFELSMNPAAVARNSKALSMSMMPNPATDEVNIMFTSGKKEKVSLTVLDVNGVKVYEKNLGQVENGSLVVPLNNLASGIYMIELTSGVEKVIQRLVKE
jgi:hypothetical protein